MVPDGQDFASLGTGRSGKFNLAQKLYHLAVAVLILSAIGFAGMALITMVMIHVYFALRPDEWHLTRSMFRGWMTRKEYQDHFDPKRWKALDDA
jgi:hypothetical protein